MKICMYVVFVINVNHVKNIKSTTSNYYYTQATAVDTENCKKI